MKIAINPVEKCSTQGDIVNIFAPLLWKETRLTGGIVDIRTTLWSVKLDEW
jgi:hypothetical protein